MSPLIKVTAFILVASWAQIAAADPPTKTDRAIAALNELCLSGNDFKFEADASGNVTMTKLTPGAQGKFTVDVRHSRGAVQLVDDKVQQLANRDIQECMKPFIQQIISLILAEPDPKKKS